MTLDEAIKESTRYINEPYSKLHPYFSEATMLLIEAGKRILFLQDPRHKPKEPLLPGETPSIDTKRSLHHIKETLQGTGEHP